MSSSREGSPDWLHCFQAPAHEALTLSSDSESSPNDSPLREDIIDHEKPSLLKTSQFLEKDKDQDIVLSDKGAELPFNQNSKAKSPKKKPKAEVHIPSKKKKINNRRKREGNGGNGGDGKVAKEETSGTPNHSVWMLSSDSESGPDNSAIRDDNIHHEEPSAHKTSQFPEKKKDEDALLIDSGGESPFKEASKEKSPKKRLKVEDHTPMKKKKVDNHMKRKGNDGDVEVAEDETSEKHIEPHGSSSRLPLVLSEKVHRSKALVECEGDSIDLSGDMGAVGRIVISDTPSRSHELFLDLKGTIYKTTIVPSRTFCIVSFGPSEAKLLTWDGTFLEQIEAVMNDFIQLKPQSNVYEAETMVEGTLDGFSFDSEDEADKMPKAITRQTDQNEGTEEQTNGKTKKRAEKTSGVVRKKGKTAGGKPPKKVRRKSQVPKKTKTKK